MTSVIHSSRKGVRKIEYKRSRRICKNEYKLGKKGRCSRKRKGEQKSRYKWFHEIGMVG